MILPIKRDSSKSNHKVVTSNAVYDSFNKDFVITQNEKSNQKRKVTPPKEKVFSFAHSNQDSASQFSPPGNGQNEEKPSPGRKVMLNAEEAKVLSRFM